MLKKEAHNCQKTKSGSQSFGFGRLELHKVRQGYLALWKTKFALKIDASQSFEAVFADVFGCLENRLGYWNEARRDPTAPARSGGALLRSWNTNSSVMLVSCRFFCQFWMKLLLAQSQFCEDLQGVWPWPSSSCRLIEEEEFSDVKIVRPVSKPLRRTAFARSFKTFLNQDLKGSRQVFIVRCETKMHTNAANSLLKVMEEPQSEIYLFLLTSVKTCYHHQKSGPAGPFSKKQAYLTELEKEGSQITGKFSSSFWFSLKESRATKECYIFELAVVISYSDILNPILIMCLSDPT